MSSKWHFEWDGKTFGPFSSTQFKELAAIGRLQPTDMVWKEGASKRVRASQVQGLFAARANQSATPKETTAAAAPAPAPPARKSAEPEVSAKSKKLSLWPGLEDYQAPPDDQLRGLLPDPDSVTLVPVPEHEKPVKAADDDSDEDEEQAPPSRSKHASPSRSKQGSPPSRSKHAPPSRSKVVKPKDSARHRSTPKDSAGHRSTPKDSVQHRSTTKHGGKDKPR
jgi:hypothetical protein